jgi:hypothetical protein
MIYLAVSGSPCLCTLIVVSGITETDYFTHLRSLNLSLDARKHTKNLLLVE